MEFDATEQAIRERGDFRASRAEGAGLLSWLGGARERALDIGARAGQRSVEARDATTGYIRRYPMGTVALGVGVGLGLGFAFGVLFAARR
jgi:ElaB/YqjD/DUF883 family membrane-anchored ribosome-binding protein